MPVVKDSGKQGPLELVGRLQTSRCRLVAKRLLVAVANSLLVAAIGVAALLALHYLATVSDMELTTWLRSAEAGPLRHVVWQVGTGLFGTTFLLLATLVLTSVPTLLELARIADKALRLDERTSTALEVLHFESHSAVEAALLRDATSRLEELDPGRIVPFPLPKAVPFVVLTAGIAVAIGALPVPAAPTGATTMDANAPMAEEVVKTAAAHLRRVAEQVSADAGSRDDEYLRAISESIEEVADRLESATVTRTELERELGSILAHTTLAYGPEAGDDVIRQLTQLRDESGATESSRASTPGGPVPEAGATAAERGMAANSDTVSESASAAGESSPETNDVESLVDTLGVDAQGFASSGPESAEGGPASAPEAERGGYWEVEHDLSAQRFGLSASQREQGVARNSDGASDQAGGGNEPLQESPAQAGESEDLAMGNEVALPEAASENGRRIEVDVPSERHFTIVADANVDAIDWRGSEAQGRSRGLVGMINRRSISSYFVPASAESEDAESGPQP